MAGHTQVLRVSKVSSVGGNLGKHIDGGRRPETAMPRNINGVILKPVVLLGADGEEITDEEAVTRRDEAASYIQECRSKKHQVRRKGKEVVESVRGPKAAPCMSILAAGPPRYGDDDAWDQNKVRAWATDTVKWVLRRAGKGARLAHCALHQDEAAPHLHVELVVADERGRLGWNRIRDRFGEEWQTSGEQAEEQDWKEERERARKHGGPPRLTVRSPSAPPPLPRIQKGRLQGPALMSAMQTNYYRDVAHLHGLERGEIGSTAVHAPVDRAKGLELRVGEERRRADERADERATVAEKAADKRERAADQRATAAEQAEKAADKRERAADQRATAAEQAEKAADKRERAADQRATATEGRVATAEQAADERATVAKQAADQRATAAEQAADKRATATEGRVAAAEQAADKRATAAKQAADQRATAAEQAADQRATAAEAERDQARTDLKTRTAERDQARTDLKTRTETRDQLIVNFDAMVGVVRELGVDRGDFDAAARRAGFGDGEARFLRSKVGPGRGQER